RSPAIEHQLLFGRARVLLRQTPTIRRDLVRDHAHILAVLLPARFESPSVNPSGCQDDSGIECAGMLFPVHVKQFCRQLRLASSRYETAANGDRVEHYRDLY